MTNQISIFKKIRKQMTSGSISNYAAIHEYFTRYLRQFKDLSETDIQEACKYWRVGKINKNEEFSLADKRSFYFLIIQGAVKLLTKYDKGYQVNALLTEGDHWTTENDPNEFGAPYSIGIEDTLLLSIDPESLLKLVTERPAFIKFFSGQNEKEIRFLQNRVTSLQVMSAYKRYENLCTNYPKIIESFNLQDIANYLGMKAETLSRIRKPTLKKVS